MSVECLDLADFLLIAEQITRIEVEVRGAPSAASSPTGTTNTLAGLALTSETLSAST